MSRIFILRPFKAGNGNPVGNLPLREKKGKQRLLKRLVFYRKYRLF